VFEKSSKVYILEQDGRNLPHPLFSNDPLRFFLGKNVVVKVDDNFAVTGRLIHYEISEKEKPHRPSILIIENHWGRHVLRGKFLSIVRREGP
jgi:hypothetical protein